MKSELIKSIRIQPEAVSWEAAVAETAAPLLEEGIISPDYIDAMITNVKENGSYIIIIPGFAMPHARPECGAIGNGLSILKLDKPVSFPGSEEVSLLMAFAAVNADEHLSVMSEMADVLMDDDKMDTLFNAGTSEVIRSQLV